MKWVSDFCNRWYFFHHSSRVICLFLDQTKQSHFMWNDNVINYCQHSNIIVLLWFCWKSNIIHTCVWGCPTARWFCANSFLSGKPNKRAKKTVIVRYKCIILSVYTVCIITVMLLRIFKRIFYLNMVLRSAIIRIPFQDFPGLFLVFLSFFSKSPLI